MPASQRPAWGEEAVVLVPKQEFEMQVSAMISPGSGIVGFPAAHEGHLIVYYEGNLFGAENLRAPEEKILNAYGRMANKYPTTAMAMMPAENFEAVGRVSPAGVTIEDPEGFDRWHSQSPDAARKPSRSVRP